MRIGRDLPKPNYPITLATIVVEGQPVNMDLPAGPLPAPNGLMNIQDLVVATPDATRRVVFESCGRAGNMSSPENRLPSCEYYFSRYDSDYWGGIPLDNLHLMRDADDDGTPVDPSNPSGPHTDYRKEGLFTPREPLFDNMVAGNIEEWTVINRSSSDHSFHIHQNPFLLTHINGQPLPIPEWRDTILVPGAVGGGGNINAATYGSVTFRMHYQPDFPGRTLMHCHVVPHGDFGMMQELEITSTE